jgi:hypothetical protein
VGNSFNIRKSLARLLYYIEQLESGKDKSAILKDLDFSNDEWQTLTKELLLFSNSKNNDWHISSLIEMKLPIELAEIISDKSKNKFTF